MSNQHIPDIHVLYEDADMAAVNKPSGLMVHPDGRSKGPFLTDWVSEKFPEAMDVGEPARIPKGMFAEGETIKRPGIVHRLDRDTSGVMLVAKTARGFDRLKKQFQARTVRKKYLAFVWGELTEEFGTITKPIGRSENDFRKRLSGRGARGVMHQAETYWSKLGTTTSREVEKDKDEKGDPDGKGNLEKFTLVLVEPKTGRTHQIRVHFTSIQHPVVGDTLYAAKKPMALGFARMALHALSIEFENCDGKELTISAPLPEDFSRAVRESGIKMNIDQADSR